LAVLLDPIAPYLKYNFANKHIPPSLAFISTLLLCVPADMQIRDSNI